MISDNIKAIYFENLSGLNSIVDVCDEYISYSDILNRLSTRDCDFINQYSRIYFDGPIMKIRW